MKKKLASLEVVESVLPAENADSLELIKLKGMEWQIVAQKGLHAVGNKVVFIIIDTVVKRRPWNEFLFKSSQDIANGEVKLSSIRLRGNISQGIVVPIKQVPEAFRFGGNVFTLKVGKDYSKRLGVRKYQKASEVEAELNKKSALFRLWSKLLWQLGLKKATGRGTAQDTGKSFPAFLTKTDELSLQSYPNALEAFNDPKNGGVYCSLKADGSSITLYRNKGKSGVASRNLDLNVEVENNFTKIYKDNIQKVPDGFAIQGEMVGPGVNGNKMNLNEHKLVVFQIIDIDKKQILDYAEFKDFCLKNGFTTVAEISLPEGCNSWPVKDWIEFSAKVAKYGNSKGEGIVLRVKKNINSNFRGLHHGRLSVKVINPDYKEAV